MRLRSVLGILSLTFSSYTLASDPKGKEEMDFVPLIPVPADPVVVQEPVVVKAKPCNLMEEITGTPTPLMMQAIEERLEAAHLFLALSNSPDPGVQKEYREHLKSSRGHLEEDRKALRSSLTSSGGKGDQKSQYLETKVSAVLTQVEETLSTPELPTHIYGLPFERFKELIERNYKAREALLKQQLDNLDYEPIDIPSENDRLAACLVVLKLFKSRINYLEACRKYLGEKRSIDELLCKNEADRRNALKTLQDMVYIVRKHQRVKAPDCFMQNYVHDQCISLLRSILEVIKLPSSEKPASHQYVLFDAEVKPVILKASIKPEALLRFQELAETSKQLASDLRNKQMDDDFRAILLSDLEEVYSQMLNDPWYQKVKTDAKSIDTNPAIFSADLIKSSKNILSYESLMQQVIAETRQKLGRK